MAKSHHTEPKGTEEQLRRIAEKFLTTCRPREIGSREALRDNVAVCFHFAVRDWLRQLDLEASPAKARAESNRARKVMAHLKRAAAEFRRLDPLLQPVVTGVLQGLQSQFALDHGHYPKPYAGAAEFLCASSFDADVGTRAEREINRRLEADIKGGGGQTKLAGRLGTHATRDFTAELTRLTMLFSSEDFRCCLLPPIGREAVGRQRIKPARSLEMDCAA